MIVLLLLMICLSPGWEKVASAPVDRVCKLKKTDVIFVLDASSSIKGSDFQTMLNFVSKFVDNTTMTGQDGAHIGIYSFGNSFKNEIPLGRYQNKTALKSAITSIRQLGGMTNTHLVLDDVLKNGLFTISNARPDAQKVVVVITDGVSLFPTKTKMAAAALKQAGVFTFAIGVGKDVDAKELTAIASKAENMFTVDNFQALKRIEKQVNSVICEQKKNPPVDRVCKVKKTDVIFVLDASSSIKGSDFQTMLNFVSKFVDHTTMSGKDGTHIGIYTFGDSFKNEIPLGRYQNKTALKSAITSIRQLGGMTNTHLVLDDVLTNGLSAKSDARPDAQKVVVVITDGVSLFPTKTKMAAAALKQAGVFTFAIGVGKDVDAKELTAIASNAENMFTVDNFQALKRIEKQVNSVICEQKKTRNCKTIATDVIFVLDASSSIEASDFTKQLAFVTKFIRDAKTIGKQGTQVGIYTFADSSVLNFPLGVYQDKSSMMLAVKHIGQLKGFTQTHLALEDVVKNGFSAAYGARKDAQKVVVVITDGQSVQRGKTIMAAEELRKLHIHTFAIGVGHKTDKHELEKIASSKEDVFSVLNFSELKDLEKSINGIVCQTPICSIKPVDIVFVLDSSSSLKDSDFQKEIDFVKSFVSASKVGPKHIQISLFTYADDSNFLIKLSDFKDRDALLRKLQTIKRSQGMTYTDRALTDVTRRAFSSANGGRGSSVKQVVIVITDGISVKPEATKAAAAVLHALNVETFAVGVGKTVEVPELHNIASDINNVNTVPDFRGLQKLQKKILKEVCVSDKTFTTPSPIVCSIKPVDIVFVLDSSSSLKDFDFQKEIDFVKSFVSASKVGPKHIQISLFTYADDSNFVIKLSDFKDRDALLRKLQTIKRSQGMTNTDRALTDVTRRAFSSANGGRGSSVKQVVIVITDGISVKPEATKAAAAVLHALNVETFAVGVGKTVDVVELHNIASDISNVNTVPDFRGLQKLQKKILKEVCVFDKTVTTPSPIVCHSMPADVIFVLDSSDSVKTIDFEKYIAFLNNFISHAKIGPQNVQFGLFLFATDSKLLISLKDLNDKYQLMQYIRNMKRTVGFTNTDKALEDVRTRGFVPEAGMRGGNVNHVAIVITDGESLKPSATRAAAQALRSMNVEVYAIGVGNTNIAELHSISSGQDYVYTVPDFNSLSHIESHLFRKLCSNHSTGGDRTTAGNTGGRMTTPKTNGGDGNTGGNTGGRMTTPKTNGGDGNTGGNTGGRMTTPKTNVCDKGSKMADVVFLLDNSDTITDDLFKRQKYMMTKFIASHTIGSQGVQVAVITFADKATEKFNLGAHKTLASLQGAVAGLQRVKGSTNTGAALKLAQSHSFQAGSGARSTSHKVVVAITDGTSNDLFVTHTAADSLRSEGVNIFCLGVGIPDIFELTAITGDSSNVIVRSDDEAIELIKDRIFDGKCGPVKP